MNKDIFISIRTSSLAIMIWLLYAISPSIREIVSMVPNGVITETPIGVSANPPSAVDYRTDLDDLQIAPDMGRFT